MMTTMVAIKDAREKIDQEGDLVVWISHPESVEVNVTSKGRSNCIKVESIKTNKSNIEDLDLVVIPNR